MIHPCIFLQNNKKEIQRFCRLYLNIKVRWAKEMRGKALKRAILLVIYIVEPKRSNNRTS
jgi:hypothetical protein